MTKAHNKITLTTIEINRKKYKNENLKINLKYLQKLNIKFYYVL